MKQSVRDTVLKILNDTMEQDGLAGIASSQADEDLSALGMDSIRFIRIIVALEEAFSVEIPDQYLLMPELNTVSKIADVICTELSRKNGRAAEDERHG